MKLGPALKLRKILANKLGGPCPCVSCVLQSQVITAQTLPSSKTMPLCLGELKESSVNILNANNEPLSSKDNIGISCSSSPSASADSGS